MSAPRWRVDRAFVVPCCFLVLVSAIALTPSTVHAQTVFEGTQDVDFDSPEAWAMKTYTSVALMSALGTGERAEKGRIDLGLEVLEVPHLDREQRTVGFGGFKEEDLNRSPAWARLRVDLGLGAGFNLSAGWVPPVEVDGVEASLVSVALARPMVSGDRWHLGWRLHAQQGEAEGDFTCAAGGDLRFPPGSADNPFGCEAPSQDTVTMDAYGASLTASYRPVSPRAPRWTFEAGWNHLDLEFQVDALTFGFRDRTLLLTDGDTTHFAVGALWGLTRQIELGIEAHYSPLDVQRPGDLSAEGDDLFHLRVLGRYRLR